MKFNYKNKVLLFIVIIKVLTFIWLLSYSQVNVIKGFWGFSTTEGLRGCILGMENFLKTGVYFPDQRMPGYGLLFLLPKIFTDRATACNILIIFQLIMGIISTFLLAEIAFKIFKTKLSFIITGVLYALCVSVSFYEIRIGSDSLAISVSIIGLYFLIKFFDTNKIFDIIFSGLLISWAIFIRPVMGALWGVMILYLIISSIKSKSVKILPILFFILPFVILESAWIIRNYIKHKEFEPLDSKHLYLSDMKDTRNIFIYPFINNFVKSWGGNCVNWDPNSESRWFGVENRSIDGSNAYSALGGYKKDLPDYIYTSKFNKDSLLVLRNKIQKIWSNSLAPDSNMEYCDFVNKKLILYTKSIKSEKPLIYYFYAPLRITKIFLVTHGTQTLINKKFSDMNIFEKLIKLITILLNIFIETVGILGIFIFIIKRKYSGDLFIPIVFTMLYIFFIGFIFKFPEVRFLAPLYPFLLICSLSVIHLVYKSNKNQLA